jgi:hypothetical protein
VCAESLRLPGRDFDCGVYDAICDVCSCVFLRPHHVAVDLVQGDVASGCYQVRARTSSSTDYTFPVVTGTWTTVFRPAAARATASRGVERRTGEGSVELVKKGQLLNPSDRSEFRWTCSLPDSAQRNSSQARCNGARANRFRSSAKPCSFFRLNQLRIPRLIDKRTPLQESFATGNFAAGDEGDTSPCGRRPMDVAVAATSLRAGLPRDTQLHVGTSHPVRFCSVNLVTCELDEIRKN